MKLVLGKLLAACVVFGLWNTAHAQQILGNDNDSGLLEFSTGMVDITQDEEAAESRQAKLFISTHNRQSEECAQLIKSILAGMKLTIRRRSVITIGHFNLVCLKDLSAYKLSKP